MFFSLLLGLLQLFFSLLLGLLQLFFSLLLPGAQLVLDAFGEGDLLVVTQNDIPSSMLDDACRHEHDVWFAACAHAKARLEAAEFALGGQGCQRLSTLLGLLPIIAGAQGCYFVTRDLEEGDGRVVGIDDFAVERLEYNRQRRLLHHLTKLLLAVLQLKFGVFGLGDIPQHALHFYRTTLVVYHFDGAAADPTDLSVLATNAKVFERRSEFGQLSLSVTCAIDDALSNALTLKFAVRWMGAVEVIGMAPGELLTTEAVDTQHRVGPLRCIVRYIPLPNTNPAMLDGFIGKRRSRSQLLARPG